MQSSVKITKRVGRRSESASEPRFAWLLLVKLLTSEIFLLPRPFSSKVKYRHIFMPPDVIFLPVPDGRKCAHTIIFVTGNPGLIGYYRRFLTSLHQNVNAAGSGRGVAVYGRSLGGFEVNSTAEKPRLHALNDEIELVWQIIDQAVQNASDHNAEKTQISLCGHSLGTYIILCVLERYYSDWHERDISYRIESAVLLFPAVADLAKSPSGKRVRLLLAIPGLPVVVGTLAWALANMIPSSLLKSIVGSSSTYREANIKNERDEAAEATVAFLKSRLGVRQTLYV